MSPEESEITAILAKVVAGDECASTVLTTAIYDELRQHAGRLFAGERPDHTLQPTALVHEACARLLGRRDAEWADRKHFLRSAATAMRLLLTDHARRHRAAKRENYHYCCA